MARGDSISTIVDVVGGYTYVVPSSGDEWMITGGSGFFYKPHEDLRLTHTAKATKKDVDEYAEHYDIHIGSIGYERDNKV